MWLLLLPCCAELNCCENPFTFITGPGILPQNGAHAIKHVTTSIDLKGQCVREYCPWMSPRFPVCSAWIFAAILVLPPTVAGGKKKDSPCSKPPDLISSAKPTKEEQEKARKVRPQGSVNIAISEDGDVVEAKVVRASSPEAADLLLGRAKSMKFKPRSGCGSFRTTVNFTLAGG